MSERLRAISALVRTTPVEELRAARAALHVLAERVLATDLYARTGYIGLRPTFDGFGQPEMLHAGDRRRVRLELDALVVQRDAQESRYALTTLADAARVVGVVLGGPLPYEPSSPVDPDTPVAIRGEVAAGFAAVFDLTASVLERVRRAVWHAGPSIAQLWPEHFDLAVKIGDVMIGGSPGDRIEDGGRALPYLYVAPPYVPDGDAYWNEPYGAAMGFDELGSVNDAIGFLTTGLQRLGLLPPA